MMNSLPQNQEFHLVRYICYDVLVLLYPHQVPPAYRHTSDLDLRGLEVKLVPKFPLPILAIN